MVHSHEGARVFGSIPWCFFKSCFSWKDSIIENVVQYNGASSAILSTANTQDAGCFLLRFVLSFFNHFVYRWCFFDAGLCLLNGVSGVLSICHVLFEFHMCIFGVLGASPSCQFFSWSYTSCEKALQVCLVGQHRFGGCDATGPWEGAYRLCSFFQVLV